MFHPKLSGLKSESNKKTAQQRGFFIGQRCSASVGLDANAFEFARGNALFPLGRACDVGAGAT
jgi:hypothetical protein